MLFPSSVHCEARRQHLLETGWTPSPGSQEEFPRVGVVLACLLTLE